MKKLKILVYISLLLNVQFSNAQELDSIKKKTIIHPQQKYTFEDGTERIYTKPRFFDIVRKIPKDFIDTNKDFVAEDHGWYLGGALASTIILIPADQYLTNRSREFSDNIGLSSDNLYLGNTPIPKNIGAGFYLVGNGTTVILLSAGFASYGLIKHDYRAQATATGLIESLVLSGVFAQTVKRITGRESPFIARQNGNDGGAWHPFPSFSDYAKNTPRYDAMPSGHLTTIMAAFTVITTNYPEYKWIKPVGYSLIAGMCFQMVQSEVHWTSDYPLAIFMGYFIGKTIAKNSFTERKNNETKKQKYTSSFFGSKINGYNTIGLSIKF